jgi:hypothetical protein
MSEFKIPEDIEDGLKRLVTAADDSQDMETMLNSAIHSFFLAQPDGKRHYDEASPEFLGSVWLTRENNTETGNASITYTASEKVSEKLGYSQRALGSIDLREKTYSLDWTGASFCDAHGFDVPDAVARDLYDVLHKLGLECAGKV